MVIQVLLSVIIPVVPALVPTMGQMAPLMQMSTMTLVVTKPKQQLHQRYVYEAKSHCIMLR